MDPTISIRPSKDLRNNYAQISALAKEHPVAITVMRTHGIDKARIFEVRVY